MSAILNHNCKHEGQDKLHGKNNRVFNHAPSKGTKPKRYKCTVCGGEKDIQ